MYSNSKNINYNLEGSTAPLAVLFMMVSMFFTIAYLKNSFNQSAMEKYRYAEKKALYTAEAGLNEVGIVALPALKGADTTLLPYPGVNYGADENGDPIGKYYDIKCYTDYYNNTTTIGFFAEASGEASYTSPNGNDIKIVRTVGTTMLPDNFAEFMYFTDKEKPVGPGNTGFVNFGPADELDGHIHTNGVMDFSQLGCPTFTGSVSLVDDNPEYDLDFECQGYCWEEFLDEDEECIVSVGEKPIDFPPHGGIETTRSSADRIFTADDLLFRAGKQDTLIMTEIHFADNGYYATQWWYNIPPVSGPPVEFDFKFDSLGSGDLNVDDGYLQGKAESEP
ncbi:MAG TPA: hypothetical protein EYQ21_04780, partial [Flavobacteriales bacterium]|nr:hypothetical protein [Flavobacteriales bacterium]